MSVQPLWETEAALALAVVKTLVLIVGSAITFFAYKAYRRTGEQALGYLAGGFAIVTLGVALAGTMYEFLGVSLAMGILLETVLVLIGFLVIAYSLSAE